MAEPRRRLISIIIPAFNEEGNIDPLYARVTKVMSQLSSRYDYEMIFTDNHSTDSTFRKLAELAGKDRRVRVFRFSRNFGFQRSIHTGYLKARGDAAVQLDCDMQDPPELIPEFLGRWEEGYQVVYGIRRSRKEAALMTALRKTFYRLIDLLSEERLPYDAGDFRLVDRRVIDELKKIDDSQPYLRGTIAAIGFNQTGISYDRAERLSGKSKFSWGDLLTLALDGIVNHSTIPLRIATYTGLAISLVTFVAILYYSFARLVLKQSWPAGFATTTILILLSLSLNALFLGIIGEYLGRIYKQVKRQPTAVIEQEVDHFSRTDLQGGDGR